MGNAIYLKFSKNYFDKGSILQSGKIRLKVIKIIPNTWWRRFLVKLGFPNYIGMVKTIQLSYEED